MAIETIAALSSTEPAPSRLAGPIDLRTAELPVGLMVRVHNRFEGRWVPGFSIAAHADGAYQLRRASDGAVLPAWFPRASVRPDES